VRHGADVVLDGRVSYPVVRQAHHERRSTDSPRAGRDNAADGC
jgi:hypothetical protein